MGRSDENNPGVIGRSDPKIFDDGVLLFLFDLIGGPVIEGGKAVSGIGNNHRRALSNITLRDNVLRAPVYPSAATKRELTEKHPLYDRSSAIPAHRSITRKFAAQMATKEEQHPVEVNYRPYQVAVQSEPEDYTITTDDDDDGYNVDCDEPVPMYVKHTEAMLDEIDLMEEVEMEDAVVEPVSVPIPDIDIADSKNPLAVVDYIDDIYEHYWNTEDLSYVLPHYMSHQYDINEKMRGILIDWLIEVHYKFELMDETLFLTINLIDRFLERQTVDRKRLQLVGVTAMLLACKYEEVSVPVVDDLILISDKAYSRMEVLDMEKLMVNKLQFNMSVPTPYVFMKRFLKAAQSEKTLELLSFFMIELCLVEYEMLKFPPSLLAAAAIYTANCSLNKFKHWNKTCARHSRYTEEQLLECSKLMVTFHQKSGTGRLTAVHKKYSTFKFGYAAKSEPAHFLLDRVI